MAYCIKWQFYVSILFFINSFFTFFGGGYYYNSGHFYVSFMLIQIGCVFFLCGLTICSNSILTYEKPEAIQNENSLRRVRFSSLLQIYENCNQSLDEDSNRSLDEDSNRSLDEDNNSLDEDNNSLDEDSNSLDEDSNKSLDYDSNNLEEDKNGSLDEYSKNCLLEESGKDQHKSEIAVDTTAKTESSSTVPQKNCSKQHIEDNAQSSSETNLSNEDLCAILQKLRQDQKLSSVTNAGSEEKVNYDVIESSGETNYEKPHKDVYLFPSEDHIQSNEVIEDEILETELQYRRVSSGECIVVGEELKHGAIGVSDSTNHHQKQKEMCFLPPHFNEISDDKVYETEL